MQWFSANISKIFKPTVLQLCRSYCYEKTNQIHPKVIWQTFNGMPWVNSNKAGFYFKVVPESYHRYFLESKLRLLGGRRCLAARSGLKATSRALWSSSPPILQTFCHSSTSITNLSGCIGVVLAHCSSGGDEAHLPPSSKLRTPPPYIPSGLCWNCSNEKRFLRLVEMSFTDPQWWP